MHVFCLYYFEKNCIASNIIIIIYLLDLKITIKKNNKLVIVVGHVSFFFVLLSFSHTYKQSNVLNFIFSTNYY